jgi:hypothetical protein
LGLVPEIYETAEAMPKSNMPQSGMVTSAKESERQLRKRKTKA